MTICVYVFFIYNEYLLKKFVFIHKQTENLKKMLVIQNIYLGSSDSERD